MSVLTFTRRAVLAAAAAVGVVGTAAAADPIKVAASTRFPSSSNG